MHVALLGGAFLIQALHSPMFGLLVLVALKIMFDLAGHLRERSKFSANDAMKAD
jgi:ABC-type Na+ efflux pump permease subunit